MQNSKALLHVVKVNKIQNIIFHSPPREKKITPIIPTSSPFAPSNAMQSEGAFSEFYGAARVRRSLHKTPAVKDEAVREIGERLRGYRDDTDEDFRPPKVMRATAQILVRLIRDKVLCFFA